eukprot:6237614-Alexandrium_andersonii.AAC.1
MAATMEAAQPAATGQRGEDLTAHTAPRPGRRVAGRPPECGNEQRRPAIKSAAAAVPGGEVSEGSVSYTHLRAHETSAHL